jgi:hypothetical protein
MSSHTAHFIEAKPTEVFMVDLDKHSYSVIDGRLVFFQKKGVEKTEEVLSYDPFEYENLWIKPFENTTDNTRKESEGLLNDPIEESEVGETAGKHMDAYLQYISEQLELNEKTRNECQAEYNELYRTLKKQLKKQEKYNRTLDTNPKASSKLDKIESEISRINYSLSNLCEIINKADDNINQLTSNNNMYDSWGYSKWLQYYKEDEFNEDTYKDQVDEICQNEANMVEPKIVRYERCDFILANESSVIFPETYSEEQIIKIATIRGYSVIIKNCLWYLKGKTTSHKKIQEKIGENVGKHNKRVYCLFLPK